MIPLIDVILLIILAGFVFYGLFFGFIRTLGLFVGVIIAAVLASRFYLPVAEWVDGLFFGYNNLGRVMVFIIVFTIINRLVGLAFYLVDRVFNIFTIIPGLKLLNRVAGAVIGFIAGSLFLGIMLYVISRYAILETFLGHWLVGSQVTSFFVGWVKIIIPFLPSMLKTLQSLI